jgi:hypothetical protein
MIVLLETDGELTMRRVRLRDRLSARFRAAALDAALVAGTSPESTVLLALHAEQLLAPAQRRLLARSLRRIVAVSEAPLGGRRAVPLNRDAVLRNREEFESLAQRLSSAEPLDVRGVAKVRTLLSDGSGPLYRAEEADRLQRELVAATSAIELSW